MAERTYWNRGRMSRRAALRGGAIAVGGLAGAALVGCGGDSASDAPASTAQSGATGTGEAGGAVPADQVRVPPGRYDDSVPPSPAEANPLVNGRRGGTLLTRYLDPPHMDFNRTLSCTVNSTMDYTKNKLTRAVFGPMADPSLIDIEPDLAESWEVNADSTQFTFHLHQGVKFHNVEPTLGREFTSEDVRVSVERYQAGGVQKDVWSPVSSIETPDDYTVIFTLSQPLVDFPRNIAAWSHMDAREMIADIDFLTEHAVGTGPFLQEEWTPKERTVFVRNPEYFEEGLPFLDRVIAVVQNDTAVLSAGFTTNNFFDWSARDDADADQMLERMDDAVYMRFFAAQGANTSGFHFQLENPKWQDERVRRAFSIALDRVEFDAARFIGEGGGYSKTPIAWQALHDSLPTLESQGQWYQYDPQAASQLLQAAGYSADNPAVADAPVWYQRVEYSSIMVPMYLEIPELQFNFREVDNPTAVSMLNARDFKDTMNITWGPPAYSVDQAVFPWYHSAGGLNHSNHNDAEMDRLVTAQRGEGNPEAQKELWHQIEDRILDQVWEVFFPTGIYSRGLWHNYMVNYRPHGIGGYVCYGNAQARAVWLDEGAPGLAVWPEVIEGHI